MLKRRRCHPHRGARSGASCKTPALRKSRDQRGALLACRQRCACRATAPSLQPRHGVSQPVSAASSEASRCLCSPSSWINDDAGLRKPQALSRRDADPRRLTPLSLRAVSAIGTEGRARRNPGLEPKNVPLCHARRPKAGLRPRSEAERPQNGPTGPHPFPAARPALPIRRSRKYPGLVTVFDMVMDR